MDSKLMKACLGLDSTVAIILAVYDVRSRS
jgi:hypothetical protein